jgi:lincosamide nucleotidyltransferase A/C/D/E
MHAPDNSLSREAMQESLTTSADVIDLYTSLKNLGAQIWIDGGWGVDALLERQTRPHKDLDIAIQEKDVPTLRQFLEARGYKEIKTEQARPHNFVLGDDKGHELDVHVIVLDDKGDGIYGPAENGQVYPAASLTGKGRIEDFEVACISPEWAIKFHSGYELKGKDFQDVSALCEKFGIELPAEYGHWKEQFK